MEWYRFDPQRRERCDTIVAAFDDAEEMEVHVSRPAERLRKRKRARVSDDAEWISVFTTATSTRWLLHVRLEPLREGMDGPT